MHIQRSIFFYSITEYNDCFIHIWVDRNGNLEFLRSRKLSVETTGWRVFVSSAIFNGVTVITFSSISRYLYCQANPACPEGVRAKIMIEILSFWRSFDDQSTWKTIIDKVMIHIWVLMLSSPLYSPLILNYVYRTQKVRILLKVQTCLFPVLYICLIFRF